MQVREFPAEEKSECRCVSEGVIELQTGMVCKWWLSKVHYLEALIREALYMKDSILKQELWKW